MELGRQIAARGGRGGGRERRGGASKAQGLCTLPSIPDYPHANRTCLRQGPGTIRLFMPDNEVCYRFCYVSRCIMSQPADAEFMLECVQSCHYSSL